MATRPPLAGSFPPDPVKPRARTTAATAWLERAAAFFRGPHGALVPVTLATAGLAAVALSGIWARSQHAAVPLDDSFIHFQYAKRLASGHFFSYAEGDPYSSGATSLLWPLLLAPFYALGARDLHIIWVAWAFGWAALGALSVETYRLASKLTGQGAALGAGAMVLCFGGYVWFASSGMEVTVLAWMLARTGRMATEWAESGPEDRSTSRLRALLVFSVLAPLTRPEGALASLLAAAALAAFPAKGARARAWSLGALASPAVMPLVHLAMTGHAVSATAVVKWLPGNPYYGAFHNLVPLIRENVRTFVYTILDGREWSAVFLPTGSRPFAIAGLLCIPLAGYLSGRHFRAGVVLVLALGMFLPCTYLSFLWNRLRYLWPFAFAWFIGLACAAHLIGELAAALRPRYRAAGAVAAGLCAGALAGRLSWTLDDLAGSASGIDRQQVTLGRWAARTLEPTARIGVNDTGAIAYVGGRPTFDVVGLTTPGEARYWVAGPGSRFEHYEKLFRVDPRKFPTHFIVYPHWMACDAVLGDKLEEATVSDQTILGGATMVAYEARTDLLGTGDRPLSDPEGIALDEFELVDELDVADLESEAEHAYVLGSTTEADDIAVLEETDDGAWADGARVGRDSDRFVAHLTPAKETLVVARLTSKAGAQVQVRAGEKPLTSLSLEPEEWVEKSFTLPASGAAKSTPLVLEAGKGERFGSAHYWFYVRR